MHGARATSERYQVLIQAFCITGDHHQQSEHLHRGAIQVGWWPPAEKTAVLCMADSCCTMQMLLHPGTLRAQQRLCHCMPWNHSRRQAWALKVHASALAAGHYRDEMQNGAA